MKCSDWLTYLDRCNKSQALTTNMKPQSSIARKVDLTTLLRQTGTNFKLHYWLSLKRGRRRWLQTSETCPSITRTTSGGLKLKSNSKDLCTILINRLRTRKEGISSRATLITTSSRGSMEVGCQALA